jgi:hypothetical protein
MITTRSWSGISPAISNIYSDIPRLFSTAASLAHHARALVAHLAAEHPWTELVLSGRAAITGPTARPG